MCFFSRSLSLARLKGHFIYQSAHRPIVFVCQSRAKTCVGGEEPQSELGQMSNNIAKELAEEMSGSRNSNQLNAGVNAIGEISDKFNQYWHHPFQFIELTVPIPSRLSSVEEQSLHFLTLPASTHRRGMCLWKFRQRNSPFESSIDCHHISGTHPWWRSSAVLSVVDTWLSSVWQRDCIVAIGEIDVFTILHRLCWRQRTRTQAVDVPFLSLLQRRLSQIPISLTTKIDHRTKHRVFDGARTQFNLDTDRPARHRLLLSSVWWIQHLQRHGGNDHGRNDGAKFYCHWCHLSQRVGRMEIPTYTTQEVLANNSNSNDNTDWTRELVKQSK